MSALTTQRRVISISRFVGLALTFAVAAAACGGESGAAATTVVPTYPPNGVTVQVLSLDNSFRAEDIVVEAGTTVTWSNRGRNDHNVVAVAKEVFPGSTWGVAEADFHPGQTFSHLFDRPGVFEYVCTIHGVNGRGMVGTVTVTG
jgi:plastocyanin